MILAAYVDGRWQPGIGDPTMMGWVTVAAYLAAAGLCAARAILVRRPIRADEPPHHWFWGLMAMGMAALAANKQIDLQSWFTQTGRGVAMDQGWYDDRRVVQQWFIGLIVLAATAGFIAATWTLRRSWRSTGLAMVGVAFLGIFIIVRAASIHHVDRLLKAQIGVIRVNWVFELGGIAIVALAAALNLWRNRKGSPSDPTASP